MNLSIEAVWQHTKNNLDGWYWSAVKAGAIGYVLPSVLLSAVLYALFGSAISGADDISITGVDPALIAVALLAILIAVAISLIYYAGLFRSVVRHEDETWQDILKAGRANALRWLGYSLVTGLILIGSAFVMAAPMLLAGAGFLVGGLLVLLWLIFALIVSIYWSVSSIVFFEERGVINALSTSYRLVSGRWWKTFAAVLVLMVITWAVSIAVLPISLLSGLVSLASPLASGVIDFAVNSLWMVFFAPFSIAYVRGLHQALTESA